jgi:hypothetical protein
MHLTSHIFPIVLTAGLCAGTAFAAPNPDDPPFVFAPNGVFGVPWGAGNYAWPQQLFWKEGMASEIAAKKNDMVTAANAILGDGRMPVLSCITTTPDLLMATGGDKTAGVSDYSQLPGWKEWGAWRKAHPEYDAITWDGDSYFPPQGYISPMMVMGPEDRPSGMSSATYGDFTGNRLGRLALEVGARGIFAADAVEGMPSGNLDFAPIVVEAFAAWAKTTIPAGTPSEQADYILKNLHPEWDDFRAHALANFYAQVAQPLLDAGLEPLVGAQTNLDPLLRRLGGTDYRIFLEHLPAKNWFFNYELQSDGSRALQPWWTQALSLGLFACREPDMRVGAQIDCDISYFWDAVANLPKDKAWGKAYLTHLMLGSSWVHVANRDGTVRRALQAYQRSYWDAGVVDADELALVRDHIPRRPFGAAIYYSVSIERTKERTAGKTTNWYLAATMQQNAVSGAPAGYFVSDAALAALPASSYPNAWIVLGAEDLSTDERAKLEAIAPVFADPYTPDMAARRRWAESLPIHFEGDGLGGFSFVDQHDQVILLVSNSLDVAITGSWVLSGVTNGSFSLMPLRGGDPLKLEVKDGSGRMEISLGANETRVYAIKGLVAPAGESPPGTGGNIPPATGPTKTDRGCGCHLGETRTAPWPLAGGIGLFLFLGLGFRCARGVSAITHGLMVPRSLRHLDTAVHSSDRHAGTWARPASVSAAMLKQRASEKLLPASSLQS